jgi:7-cyano-7-deazaguanine synthase
MKKAIVVLSGGLDSSTCVYVAKSEGYEVHALSFLYGQRHKKELDSAAQIAKASGVVEHRILALPKPIGSALSDDIEVPKDRSLEQMSTEIPVTYVPARNTVFIALALQYAEEIDADAIYLGLTAIDYSGYPDCRPEYVEAWQNLINLATKKTVEGGKIELKAPLMQLYKAEIIDWGTELGVPYGLTWSCYNGGDKACGKCDSCLLRLKGFKEANLTDPIQYEQYWWYLIGANGQSGKK